MNDDGMKTHLSIYTHVRYYRRSLIDGVDESRMTLYLALGHTDTTCDKLINDLASKTMQLSCTQLLSNEYATEHSCGRIQQALRTDRARCALTVHVQPRGLHNCTFRELMRQPRSVPHCLIFESLQFRSTFRLPLTDSDRTRDRDRPFLQSSTILTTACSACLIDQKPRIDNMQRL